MDDGGPERSMEFGAASHSRDKESYSATEYLRRCLGRSHLRDLRWLPQGPVSLSHSSPYTLCHNGGIAVGEKEKCHRASAQYGVDPLTSRWSTRTRRTWTYRSYGAAGTCASLTQIMAHIRTCMQQTIITNDDTAQYAEPGVADGLEWGVRSGFHAVPSMRHLHLHVRCVTNTDYLR